MAEIRLVLVSHGVAAAYGLTVNTVLAQTYPSKPIRMVVGFAAGGGADTTARLIAQKLPDVLGQQVVVENRAGASGAIANERVATAPPDGYTVLLMASSLRRASQRFSFHLFWRLSYRPSCRLSCPERSPAPSPFYIFP